MKSKIYPSITSTDKNKIPGFLKEIVYLHVDEICLFLTGLLENERKNLLEEIGKTNIKNIPFVHLRSDATPDELDFLINKYHTKCFNIHSESFFKLKYDLSKYKKQLYVENTIGPLDEKELQNYAGICIDLSHVEDNRLNYENFYLQLRNTFSKFYCGCGHISAIKEEPRFNEQGVKYNSVHISESLSEFDYLKNYKDILPPILALELENPIEEQLKIIKYIHGII